MFEPSFCQICQKELTGVMEIVSDGRSENAKPVGTTDINWSHCDSCKSAHCVACEQLHLPCRDLSSTQNIPKSEVAYGGF